MEEDKAKLIKIIEECNDENDFELLKFMITETYQDLLGLRKCKKENKKDKKIYYIVYDDTKDVIEIEGLADIFFHFGGLAEHIVSRFADDNNLKISIEKAKSEIERLFYENFVENWNKYCKYGLTAMNLEELNKLIESENEL